MRQLRSTPVCGDAYSPPQPRRYSLAALPMTRRRGAAAAIAGGVLWLVLWGHQLVAHGTTEENEKKLLLGLTWMDSAKFYVVAFVLFLLAAVSAYRLAGAPTRFGRAAFWLTAGALVTITVGTAIQFWPFPWGSYARGYDDSHARYGGIVQAVSSVVLTLGLILFAIYLSRRGVLRWWEAAILVLAGPTTVFLSPAVPFPGAAWLITGIVLLTRAERSRVSSAGP